MLEAVRGGKTIDEIAALYGIHPNQVTRWKKQLVETLPDLFSRGGSSGSDEQDRLIHTLRRQVDQLKVEVEWLRSKTKQKAKD